MAAGAAGRGGLAAAVADDARPDRAGEPDYLPTAEPRLGRAVARAYGLERPPSAADLTRLAAAWRPYRTWVALLLRTMLEDEMHEIAAGAPRAHETGT